MDINKIQDTGKVVIPEDVIHDIKSDMRHGDNSDAILTHVLKKSGMPMIGQFLLQPDPAYLISIERDAETNDIQIAWEKRNA